MFARVIYIISSIPLSVLAISATCKASSWQPQHPVCTGPPEVYEVRPSNGKGLGVFAAYDLEIGDIVMRETPVIKIPRPTVVKKDPYPMSEVYRLVLKEFEALSPDAQEAVLSLTYHTSATESETINELGVIFRTNAYNTGNNISLLPKMARINHSCRPNSDYYWNEKLNTQVVYASRKIKKGEELSVSYISLLLTHQERQKDLDRYGFTCSCEACNQEREVSDDRRITIRKAFTDFESQLSLEPLTSETAKRQARNNAKASLQLAELVQEEGLAIYYARAFRITAISHARVEDWEPAAIWASRGYELRYMEDPESTNAQEMHHLTSFFIASWENTLRNRSST
ncbi:SET domain-containing protein [Clathrospora elynae]|uniref:SET domain-containing protein n=1 Tax=Clathrospora elynae TaxID=706981 RepID=A0A6A5SMP2_9PLEO|nr:SET domain-containing protein [Clathrospora elynae]